ncbi:MAG TPA: hypothetical protein VNW97_04120 [Candidatus Saccharimonadales bacterium]|jgi:hypothetical protein|nr:hypothetical protein [Candidatus Saccharimonadales bacterium]
MEWRAFSTHVAAIIAGELFFAAAGGAWIYLRRKQLFERPWMISLITAFVTTVLTTSLTWLAVGMVSPPRFAPFSPQAHHQLEFWTPTVKTKDASGVKEDDNYKWLVMDDNGKLIEFAKALSHNRREIVGFRWNEVEGRGEGSLQAGAWWVVTLGEGLTCTQFFRQYYGPIWNPGRDGVYYEINGTGDHWYQNQKCVHD